MMFIRRLKMNWPGRTLSTQIKARTALPTTISACERCVSIYVAVCRGSESHSLCAERPQYARVRLLQSDASLNRSDFFLYGKCYMRRIDVLEEWFASSGVHKNARKRHRFSETQFAPYVRAIGQLLLAWNDLHERLLMLFIPAIGADLLFDGERISAIWHSIRQDNSKRKALRAAINRLPADDYEGRDKLVDEICWVLDMTDKLEGLRDDAAHTPLHSALPRSTKMVFPNKGYGNPRAMRILDKKQDVLTEYSYAYKRILMLRDYVIAIDFAWRNPQLPWPDRPQLPERTPNRQLRGPA